MKFQVVLKYFVNKIHLLPEENGAEFSWRKHFSKNEGFMKHSAN